MKFSSRKIINILTVASLIGLLVFIAVNVGWDSIKPAYFPVRLKLQSNNLVTASLSSEFELGVNQAAQLDSGRLSLTFVKVEGDSRCPVMVQCFWSGEATILLGLRAGTPLYTMKKFSTLGMGDKSDGAVHDFKNYTIELVSLEPYPNKSEDKNFDEYKATFKVTKK